MVKFDVEKCDGYEDIVEIINADNEAKHFVRRRVYTPSSIADDRVISEFEPRKHIRHRDGGFIKALGAFLLSFLVFGAMSIYVGVTAPDKLTDFIALFLVAGFMGVLLILFFVLHLSEHAFMNSTDDLFILYDRFGTPCSVEIRKNRARVLYKDTLYVVKHGKVRKVQKEEKLYRAYLNLYPASVLDMEKYSGYICDSDKAPDAYVVSSVKSEVSYMPEGTTRLSIANYMSLGEHTSWHTRTNKYLQFCKFLFVVDNELKIKSIYSAVSDEAFYDYSVLTLAEVRDTKLNAEAMLGQYSEKDRALKSLLKDTLHLDCI